MKIKKTKQVRLDELLKYVWDNGITDEIFENYEGSWVRFDECGDLVEVYEVEESDLFTITEEVEITEDMRLNLVVIDDDYEVTTNHYTKISQILKESETYGYEIKFIYLQNDDGSIGELIWDKERGLVD